MSDTSSAGAQPPKSPAKSSSSHPYKVYRQGFLLKCPPRAVRKKLHRYWFVLFKQKDMLAFLYFQDEDHYLERKKNEGFFRIDDLTSIDVIPEHMGRKNAFCIATPRAKYQLVSESRYELHHWLLALHGAIDDYKNSTAGRNSGSNKKKAGGRSRAHSQSTGTSPPASLTKNQTRIKPSRPAPRAPPKDKKKGDEENIPPSAAVAPLDHDHQSTTTTTTTTSTSSTHEDLPSPTTNKLDDLVAGLLQESNEVHTTLDYTLTEDEYLPMFNGGDNTHEEGEETGSLSTSMPILNDNKDSNTTEESAGNSDENTSPPPSHIRHLSFSSSQEFTNRQDNKRRMSKKRSGSIKGRRSVSPPNLPPPPPPPTEEEQTQEYTGENVINSLEPQGNIKLSPKPPIPARTTSLNPNQTSKVGGMEVGQYLDEAFNEEDDKMQQQPTTTDNGDRKSPGILRKAEQHKQPINSGGPNTKRTVVFDESARGGRYEPMVDHESLPVQPNIVAATKQKLFGSQESESFRYNRQVLQNQSNVPMEHQDELLEAIETALQPTSYMEQQGSKVGRFSAEIQAPPTVPIPNRPPSWDYSSSERRYSLETSPKEVSTHEPPPVWSNPTFDDTPTTTTFASNQDTMYRSIV